MRLSIIIPVLNEATIINDTLAHIASMPFTGLREVIVVDGDSNGATLQAIIAPGVQGLVSRAGRARQMNTGAASAKGDILLFLHADTLLPPQGLSAVDEICGRGDLAGGAFDLSIQATGWAYRLIEQVANWRSHLSRIPYGDQAIFLKRDVFDRLGGYRELPLMEDVDLMRRLKKAGGRIAIGPLRVQTSARRWQREGILYTTFRNWALMGLYLLGVSADRLKRHYPPQ